MGKSVVEEALNGQQREAVEHGEGPLLVLAGAGSGKTRVLTYRIAHLIGTEQAKPSQIMAITFTNKAAGEMRERVERLLGRVSRQMWVMTFHSACSRILRSEAERLGYKRSFTIFDEADALRLIRNCMDELDLDQKRFAPRALRRQISDAKTKLKDALAYSSKLSGLLNKTSAQVYELYEKRLFQMNAMDFDDLLMQTVSLFQKHGDVLERYQEAFRWMLVDEYQDTNHAQYVLLKLLAGRYRNLSVVGDDDQSIYRFRGADIRNILDFEKDFPDAKVIRLEQNYRSTQRILSAAHAVVSNNLGRKPKQLWTEAGDGARIEVAELKDEHEEARYIAAEVERLAHEGVGRQEIAVFYRTNAQSRVLEDTFVRYSISYQVIGGTKFYERAEVKDAMAYLSLLANPDDDVSLQRVVNSPRRGIGATTVAKLSSHASTVGSSLWQAVNEAGTVPGLGSAAIKALEGFIGMIEQLREMASKADVAELLKLVLEKSGYLEALEAERTIEAQGRVENLQELIGVAREYDEQNDSSSLVDFLQEVALFTDQDAIVDDEGVITLMTLHNAKGLEFPAVFIIGCEEGVFPHSRALDQGDLEEERRLCYVGITRACSRLYLTYTRQRSLYGRSSYNLPSRFISEIPVELVNRVGVSPAVDWGDDDQGPFEDGENGHHEKPAPAHFRAGDDVVHAAFGSGVVLDVEPGGLVLVRFADDGSERKLVIEHAPLVKQ